jgi:hypothetical protein
MQRFIVFLCFSMIFCFSAFPKDSGTIQCDSDMKQVMAWTGPGNAMAAESLACSQTVNIIGLEKGYYQIKIGEKFAYVDAKYVIAQQQANSPAAQTARTATPAQNGVQDAPTAPAKTDSVPQPYPPRKWR